MSHYGSEIFMNMLSEMRKLWKELENILETFKKLGFYLILCQLKIKSSDFAEDKN